MVCQPQSWLIFDVRQNMDSGGYLVVVIVILGLAGVGAITLFTWIGSAIAKRHPSKDDSTDGNRISSEDLAAIIIDALNDVGIVQRKDAPRALEIATDKIDGRKELGDY